MNLTRRCSQPTLIITVRIIYHQEANINKSGLEIYLCTHFSLYSWTCGSVLPRDKSSQSNGIHPYPSEYDHIPSAWHVLCFSSQPWVSCNDLNDLVSWNGIEYDSWGELQVKHLLGFVNLTHPGKVWHSKLSMATSSNYSTLGLNIKGIQGHCVFTFFGPMF